MRWRDKYKGGNALPCSLYNSLLKQKVKFIQADTSSYTALISPSKTIFYVPDFKSNGIY